MTLTPLMQQAIDLRKQGLKPGQIQEKLQCSGSTLAKSWKYAKAHGIDLGPNAPKKSPNRSKKAATQDFVAIEVPKKTAPSGNMKLLIGNYKDMAAVLRELGDG